MLTPSTPALETERHRLLKGWQLAAVFGLLAVIYVIGFAVGGELRAAMVAGLESLPFMLLALLAYLGIDRLWGKVLALLWLLALVGGTGLMAVGYSLLALLDNPTLQVQPGTFPRLVDGGGVKLAIILVGSLVAGIVGLLGFIPGVRRALSRVLPLDPASFVHTIALVGVVTITLLCFIPLLVLAVPPVLPVIAKLVENGTDISGGRGDGGQLRDRVYALTWTIPGTVIAVGYGVRRNLRAALERLGLVRPTWRQVLFGVGLAIVLVGAVQLLGFAIDWLWNMMGWPQTDEEAFGELLAFAMSPIGALVVGVTAGLGEELAVRGVLQPRLGILLSNLFFTGLHAFQYNWDSLLVVFAIGLIFGVLRKRTNTTTSAIAHGTYDFVLIILTVLQVPWFSQ